MVKGVEKEKRKKKKRIIMVEHDEIVELEQLTI